MNYNDIIGRLVYEFKLHDSDLIMIKLLNNELYFYVSCKGMDLNYYGDDIEDIVLKFYIKEIKNISFIFDGNIMINDFDINENDDVFILKTDNDDFYIECLDFEIEVCDIKKYNVNKYKSLDSLLKSDI